MSLTHAVPYLVDRVLELGDDFREIEKPFETDIPSTIIDKSFYIIFIGAYSESRNMIDFPMVAQCEMRIFRKGFASESNGRVFALADAHAIIKNCMKISNSNTQPSIKNVVARTVDIEALKDNDNTVMAKILFDLRIVIDPNL